jgi:hypothetical protein
MKKILTTIVLIFAAGSFLAAQKKIKPEKLCISDEEFAVYKVLGVGNFQNETSRYTSPDLDYLKTKLPDISPETLADFQAKNDKTYLLRCLDRTGGKPKKLKRSWGGITSISFSRIGFNTAKTEALVYSGFSTAGNYCGIDLVWLKKKNDRWEIIERVNLIIC